MIGSISSIAMLLYSYNEEIRTHMIKETVVAEVREEYLLGLVITKCGREVGWQWVLGEWLEGSSQR